MDSSDGVIVAGAGPVGMVAALWLARAGIPVTVLEAGGSLSEQSRASTFHPPTLEILDELGVADELTSVGVKSPTVQYRDRRLGVIAEFDLSLLKDETKFPYRLQCEQSVLTPIILDRLGAFDHAQVLFDRRVVGVRQEGSSVVAEVQTPSWREEVRSRWLIGADGARSAVRQSLDIDFEGFTYPERYLVITTDLDLSEVVPDIALVNYVFDPSEWFVLLRTHREWRALFPVREGVSEAELREPASLQARMQILRTRNEPYPISHVTLYNVHQRVASTFRRDGTFLVGDAAHVNNPIGGLGMNSGVHDAYVVAGALARVMDGSARAHLLDDAAVQRRTFAVEAVQQMSHENWSAIRQTDEQARREYFDDLRYKASDIERSKAFMRKTSLLATAPPRVGTAEAKL